MVREDGSLHAITRHMILPRRAKHDSCLVISHGQSQGPEALTQLLLHHV